MNRLVLRVRSIWNIDVHPGHGRRMWTIICVNALVTAVAYGTAPFIPLVLDEDGTTGAEIGIVLACLALGQFAGQVPAAWLATRVSLRLVVGFALIVEAVAALGFAFSQSLLLFGITRLLAGFGKALVSQSTRVAVTQSVPSGVRGKAFGVLGGASMTGIMFGPAVAGVIVALTDARIAFVASAVLSLMAMLLLPTLRVKPSSIVPAPPPTPQADKSTERPPRHFPPVHLLLASCSKSLPARC